MAGRRDEPSARSRIIAAADHVFASAVPAAARASTTSRFDIVGRAQPDSGWVNARLLQWHRVGGSGLRCIVALEGPSRPTYNEAVAALAEKIEHLVVEQQQRRQQQQRQQQQQHTPAPPASAAALRSSTRPPTTTTPLPAYTTSLELDPQTPTGTRPTLTPTSLTPRATIILSPLRSRSSSSSASSTSTIRPSTAPPGALPTIYNSDPPPLPGPIPSHLTPKRSLTSRLTPFSARWSRRPRDSRPPQTPTRQRTTSLQRWSSKMKSSRDHKRQLQRLKTAAPMYTLDPDQGPSPITPTGRTMPPLAPPARPLGPRTQPNRGDERRSQRDPFERVRAATAEPVLPPLPPPIDSSEHQRRRRTPTGRESRAPRAPGPPPCTAAAAAPRTASPVSESVWDDVDELTRELRERNRLDRERSRLREEAELRLRREIGAFPVRRGRGATAAEETDGSGAGEDGAWHPQPARRFPWTSLRSSRSKSRSRE